MLDEAIEYLKQLQLQVQVCGLHACLVFFMWKSIGWVLRYQKDNIGTPKMIDFLAPRMPYGYHKSKHRSVTCHMVCFSRY